MTVECECKVGGLRNLLLQTSTRWELLFEDSLGIFTFKVLTLILTTDKAGHPMKSLMTSVSNEGFPWENIIRM